METKKKANFSYIFLLAAFLSLSVRKRMENSTATTFAPTSHHSHPPKQYKQQNENIL
jgi:hypothetical protein